jgi:hypothetical protein
MEGEPHVCTATVRAALTSASITLAVCGQTTIGWVRAATLTEPGAPLELTRDDGFGRAIGLAGNRLLVGSVQERGARLDGAGGRFGGAVHFDLNHFASLK